MLGCDLQLSGNMMPDNLFKIFKAVCLIFYHQIMAYSGTDENLFNLRHLPEFFQQGNLGEMADFQLIADDRRQAALFPACAFGFFSLAFDAVHIGGGASDIVNVSFKFRMVG